MMLIKINILADKESNAKTVAKSILIPFRKKLPDYIKVIAVN